VSDLFLDPGKAIVETARPARPSRTSSATQAAAVAAAPDRRHRETEGRRAGGDHRRRLQDHDRAVVDRHADLGKGLVQSFWRLTPEPGLKLTTARWFTPSGRTMNASRATKPSRRRR